MSPTETLAQSWSLGVWLFLIAFICAFMVGLPVWLGGRYKGRAKNDPFDRVWSVPVAPACGLRQVYLIAMFFVIFDVEALFLYAWAVSVKEAGWAGFVVISIFAAELLLGLWYLHRIGALDWAPVQRRRRIDARARQDAASSTPSP